MRSNQVHNATLATDEMVKFSVDVPSTIKVAGTAFSLGLHATKAHLDSTDTSEDWLDADFDEMTPVITFTETANFKHSIQPGIYALKQASSTGTITITIMS